MIEFQNVSKRYPNGTLALNDVSLRIDKGEFVFVLGASGAGKSTFLKLIMREEVPTSGSIFVNGSELNRLKARKVPYFRRKLGIVFQDFRLIPNMTVYDNVAFALRVTGAKNKDIARRVAYALSLVGLSHKAKMMPNELSGGEQQRVSLARALVNKADIIIADEPTGNIDPEMSRDIVDLLNQININSGTTIIMVTHEHELVRQYDKRIITIRNGTLAADTAHPDIQTAQEEAAPAAPVGFYHVPNENTDVENFLRSYGTDSATEDSAAAALPENDAASSDDAQVPSADGADKSDTPAK